jgi:CSLREA domain-containing protein
MDRASAASRWMRSGLLTLAALPAVWPVPADAAATFTVNRTGDAKDRNLGDGVCDALREGGKQCSLRAAIQGANSTPASGTINFDIGGPASVKTISPTRPLPAITEPLTVDGYSQAPARTPWPKATTRS